MMLATNNCGATGLTDARVTACGGGLRFRLALAGYWGVFRIGWGVWLEPKL